jgi:hypothetical protein
MSMSQISAKVLALCHLLKGKILKYLEPMKAQTTDQSLSWAIKSKSGSKSESHSSRSSTMSQTLPTMEDQVTLTVNGDEEISTNSRSTPDSSLLHACDQARISLVPPPPPS